MSNALPPITKIRLARFTSDAGLLTKTVSLDHSGKLQKHTEAKLTRGRVENLALENLEEFSHVLINLSHNQALSYGVCLPGDGPIMSADEFIKAGRPSGVWQRNKQQMGFPDGRGIIMLDHDPATDGEQFDRDQLLERLYRAMPAIEFASHLWWASASSCIYNIATGEMLSGVRGQRVYVVVDRARDIPRIGKILAARLWAEGFGYIKISTAGSLLERTLVDTSVWQPERLDFAAGAKCSEPLEQRRPDPVILGGGAPLEARTVLELSDRECQMIERKKELAKAPVRVAAKQIREARIQKKAEQLQAARSLEKETAEAIARDAYESHRLMGDWILQPQAGGEVTVKEILECPDVWHGERFRDPVEPEYNDDDRIAYANLCSGSRPYLFSHAHGGVRYELCRAVDKVNVSQGEMGLATERTLAIMRSNMTFYERAGAVVVVAPETGEVLPQGVYGLKQRLEGYISFERYDGREKKLKRTDCPDELARRVLDMRGERGLPKLSAVALHPTMTHHGRLVSRPGFDGETGLLLLNPTGEEWPGISARPSDQEVMEALARLWTPYREFPFVDETSRAITLAALLTAVVRRTLPTAPAFMFAAPCAGSGKTLLASCVVELAGGAATTSLPHGDEEIRKTLVAHLRGGHPAIFFDNVVGVVNSKDLNAVLTSEMYEARILGQSATSGSLPTNTLVILTGNNARPAGDTCRRMLVSTIDPRMADPYSRRFDFDPRDLVRSQEMPMVIAALTILSGWVASRLPPIAQGSLGSFEAWERLVRQAVVWVGELERTAKGANAVGFGDPIGDVKAQYAQDDETEALGDVLRAWQKAQVGTAGFKAVQLFEVLRRSRDGSGLDDGLGALGDALRDVIHPKVVTPKGVARWLRTIKGRVVGDLRIESRLDQQNNNQTWFVQCIAV